MDWKKLGIFRFLNRVDVWQNIFEFLDVKSVTNGLSKSCKTFKILCLLHISHIKSICILTLHIENKTSYTSLIEFLKCEKTFLLKINSSAGSKDLMDLQYTNKSVVRLKYKSENGDFSLLMPLLKTISAFKYLKISGNALLPILTDEVVKVLLGNLTEKKIVYLKIAKVTLENCAFNRICKYIKAMAPMVFIFDVACSSKKVTNFQNYLAKLWKKKWLLTINYKINGKALFTCTRDFLA